MSAHKPKGPDLVQAESAQTRVKAPRAERFAGQSRLAFGAAVHDLALADEAIYAISADTLDLMGFRLLQQSLPERVIECGIAEQNAMGIASGLASTGLRPFLGGYAPFITARSMEQLRNDVSYAQQRVVIGGAASGISLGVAGGTHHALEDLAIMQCLPHMTAVVPADPLQAYWAVMASNEVDGPMYIRLGGRVQEMELPANQGMPWQLGKAQTLREGSDLSVIACGVMVQKALDAARQLELQGLSLRVINMHTIKPLDLQAIERAAVETGGIVTAEEHRLSGGLGSAVAQWLACHLPTRMRMIGMPDQYAMVGPTEPLREHYGLSAKAIEIACLNLLKDRV